MEAMHSSYDYCFSVPIAIHISDSLSYPYSASIHIILGHRSKVEGIRKERRVFRISQYYFFFKISQFHYEKKSIFKWFLSMVGISREDEELSFSQVKQ